MPRPGSSTQRGYGAAHQRARRQLKAELRCLGTVPCARGGEPLHAWQLDLPRGHPASIHADHVGTPRSLGGQLPDALSCAHHNQQHGARLGNRMRARRRQQAMPRPVRVTPLPVW